LRGECQGVGGDVPRAGNPVNESDLRDAVVGAARGMNTAGVNRGTSGNLSVRVGDGMLITPSTVAYEHLTPSALVSMALDGSVQSPASARPSTEWRLHAAIYQHRADVQAVLHAHPRYATALACVRRGIPAFHYMVAVAGGDDIRCSEYATVGTAALAHAAVAALEDRRACLLANHGIVVCGGSPAEALALAVEVETLAAQYVSAIQVGEPVLLPDEEMRRVCAAFEDYRRA
jgi:L-fuculose-phosphate aldolase